MATEYYMPPITIVTKYHIGYVSLRIIDVLVFCDEHKGGGLGGVLGVTRSQGLHLKETSDSEEEVD